MQNISLNIIIIQWRLIFTMSQVFFFLVFPFTVCTLVGVMKCLLHTCCLESSSSHDLKSKVMLLNTKTFSFMTNCLQNIDAAHKTLPQ